MEGALFRVSLFLILIFTNYTFFIKYIDLKVMRIVVKTLFGLENILAQEIKELGGKDIEKSKRAVAFYGNKKLLYKSNYCLRTGLKVLQSICAFRAIDEDDLYKKTKAFRWSAYMNAKQTFAIDATVFSKNFTHSKFAALKVKDGIVDHFRKECGERPNVDTENPDVRLNVHIAGKEVIISFDSSGESLHKRGYRVRNHKAPLNEVLANGMLQLAGWKADIPLYDPMCGSGTLLIEAAMMGKNIPAGKYREKFGFMSWTNFDEDLWKEVKEEADALIISPNLQIYGSDILVLSVDIAKEAILKAELSRDIKLTRRSFERFVPDTNTGILMFNPPYGERLKTSDIDMFYKMIGNKMKEKYVGFSCWIISSNMEAFKQVGLHADTKIKLYNGALECDFRNYNIYQSESE